MKRGVEFIIGGSIKLVDKDTNYHQKPLTTVGQYSIYYERNGNERKLINKKLTQFMHCLNNFKISTLKNRCLGKCRFT